MDAKELMRAKLQGQAQPAPKVTLAPKPAPKPAPEPKTTPSPEINVPREPSAELSLESAKVGGSFLTEKGPVFAPGSQRLGKFTEIPEAPEREQKPTDKERALSLAAEIDRDVGLEPFEPSIEADEAWIRTITKIHEKYPHLSQDDVEERAVRALAAKRTLGEFVPIVPLYVEQTKEGRRYVRHRPAGLAEAVMPRVEVIGLSQAGRPILRMQSGISYLFDLADAPQAVLSAVVEKAPGLRREAKEHGVGPAVAKAAPIVSEALGKRQTLLDVGTRAAGKEALRQDLAERKGEKVGLLRKALPVAEVVAGAAGTVLSPDAFVGATATAKGLKGLRKAAGGGVVLGHEARMVAAALEELAARRRVLTEAMAQGEETAIREALGGVRKQEDTIKVAYPALWGRMPSKYEVVATRAGLPKPLRVSDAEETAALRSPRETPKPVRDIRQEYTSDAAKLDPMSQDVFAVSERELAREIRAGENIPLTSYKHGPGWRAEETFGKQTETAPTEMGRRVAAPHPVKQAVGAVLFGGNEDAALKALPRKTAMAIKRGIRLVETTINDAARLGMEQPDNLARYLTGESGLRHVDGSPVLTDGTDYWSTFQAEVREALFRAETPDAEGVVSDAALTRFGRSGLGRELALALSGRPRDYSQGLYDLVKTLDKPGTTPDKFFAALSQAEGFQSPGKLAQAKRRLSALAAARASAAHAREGWKAEGLALDPETHRNLWRFVEGRTSSFGTDAGYREAMGILSRTGTDLGMRKMREELDEMGAVLNSDLLVPRAAMMKLDNAIRRAVPNLDDPRSMNGERFVLRLWKNGTLRGIFVDRPRYFYNNWRGAVEQAFVVGGVPVAMKQALRDAPILLMAVPGTTNVLALLDTAAKVAGKRLNVNLIRQSLNSAGDAFANVLSAYGRSAPSRLALEGHPEVVLNGYTGRQIRDVAIREGVFEAFDKKAMEHLVTGAVQSRFGRAAKQVLDFLGHEMLARYAEDVGQRQRLGLMLSFMERGKTPEEAARLSTEILFDYSALSSGDRSTFTQFLIPFWAWQKNAQRWTFRQMLEPGTAYRMGIIRRLPQTGGRAATWLLAGTDRTIFGVNPDAMSPEMRDYYEALKTDVMERYPSGDVPAEEVARIRAYVSKAPTYADERFWEMPAGRPTLTQGGSIVEPPEPEDVAYPIVLPEPRWMYGRGQVRFFSPEMQAAIGDYYKQTPREHTYAEFVDTPTIAVDGFRMAAGLLSAGLAASIAATEGEPRQMVAAAQDVVDPFRAPLVGEVLTLASGKQLPPIALDPLFAEAMQKVDEYGREAQEIHPTLGWLLEGIGQDWRRSVTDSGGKPVVENGEVKYKYEIPPGWPSSLWTLSGMRNLNDALRSYRGGDARPFINNVVRAARLVGVNLSSSSPERVVRSEVFEE